MSDTVERKEDPQSLAEKLRDERLTVTVSDLELEYLKYLRQHPDPETAAELEYRIRKEKLHNAIMAEVQRAYNAGELEVKNVEDFCTLVKLDLFLLDGES